MDHSSAVIDVDYAPTGREFVSGSYDKTVRIFESLKGHSRDVYHTKRMQRLTCVKWSLDNKYILTGSDEMNIRMWKARASEKLGVVSIDYVYILILFFSLGRNPSWIPVAEEEVRGMRSSYPLKPREFLCSLCGG